MQLYQQEINVIVTSKNYLAKNGITQNTPYLVLGIDLDNSKFWIVNDNKDFEYIPIHACKYYNYKKEDENERNNNKSNGEYELLEKTPRGKSTSK